MIDVIQDKAHTFEVYAEGGVPASATVTVYSPTGATVVAGAATVDTVSATVSAVTSQQSLTLDNTTDVEEGRQYLVTGGGNERALVRVESKTATAVTLTDRAQFTIAVSDTFKGARVSYTLGSSYTGTRGHRYRVAFDITLDDGTVERRSALFSVTRMRFRDPMTPAAARAYLASVGASLADRWSSAQQKWVELADRANRMVRRRLLAASTYPHLLADEDLFEGAGLTALRIVLSEHGLVPNDADGAAYGRDLEQQLAREIDEAVAANVYDADDDNVPDETESGRVVTRWVR